MAPEIVAVLAVAGAVTFAVAVHAAVWGWQQGVKYQKQHQQTMSSVDEILAEPEGAEQWPRPSN